VAAHRLWNTVVQTEVDDASTSAATNGACVKELGRTNRKGKVLKRVFKYWERLLEMEESSLLGDALTYQREEWENNWICGIKQELEKLGMGYMWRRGRENDRNSWKMVSQRCRYQMTRHGHNHEREKNLNIT
jgi:hypothetical protein